MIHRMLDEAEAESTVRLKKRPGWGGSGKGKDEGAIP